jgi:hypothetical protein
MAAQFTILFSFNGSNGANPEAGFIADANGDLFGTTSGAWAYGDGTVFEPRNTGTAAASPSDAPLVALDNMKRLGLVPVDPTP